MKTTTRRPRALRSQPKVPPEHAVTFELACILARINALAEEVDARHLSAQCVMPIVHLIAQQARARLAEAGVDLPDADPRGAA